MDLGEYRIKCVKQGGETVPIYDYGALEGEELDLLDPELPDTLRAADYQTACNMCEDVGFPLAQRIADGSWVLVRKRAPLPSME
jgi:hypothetical protein